MVKVSGATRNPLRRGDTSGLAGLHQMWTDRNFQENWVKYIRADLEALKDAFWEMNFENLKPEHARFWVDQLGLPIPKGAEEYRLALMCLRSIVKYTEWKLSVLEKASNRYAGDRQLELEREQNHG